jgi:hypothetical protein
MCDSSVQFIGESIDRKVWQALATPDAGELINAGF